LYISREEMTVPLPVKITNAYGSLITKLWSDKLSAFTGVPPYLQLIRSKTYRGYVKPQITANAIYNVIFV
jgi:hypothetical protein